MKKPSPTWIERCRATLAILAITCTIALSSSAASGQVIVSEDFDAIPDVTLSGDSKTINPSLEYAGDTRNTNLVSLLSGSTASHGAAWFEHRIQLNGHRVQISFDFWVRHAKSSTVGEGLSAVLQFGTDFDAAGDGGGRLGTCNFPSDYVSVAFDLIDQGAVDPETWCDGRTPRTCHVEINDNLCPGNQASTRTNVTYGVETPDFVRAGDQLVPVTATIVIDDGVMDVYLNTANDPLFATQRVQVLTAPSALLNADWAIFGLIGTSSDQYNAHMEVDNVRITSFEKRTDASTTLFGGFQHRPLGRAELAVQRDGTLSISECQDVQADGVEIDLGPTSEAREVETEIVSLSLSNPPPEPFFSTALEFLGAEEELLGGVRMHSDRSGNLPTQVSVSNGRVPEVALLVAGREVAVFPGDDFTMDLLFEHVSLESERDRNGEWTTLLSFSSPLTVTAPSLEGRVRGDALRIRFASSFPQMVRILSSGDFSVSPVLRSTQGEARESHIEETILGDAQVHYDSHRENRRLVLSNIGASGKDGIEFRYEEPRPSTGVVFDPIETGPCGGENPWNINFCGVDEEDNTIAQVDIGGDDDGVSVLPSFGDSGADGYTVQLFRRGVAIAEIPKTKGVAFDLPPNAKPSRIELRGDSAAQVTIEFDAVQAIDLDSEVGILNRQFDTICIDPTNLDTPSGFVAETCVQFVCVDDPVITPDYHAPPIAEIDLRADAIEVTQAIQNLNNDVRLINGKSTYVRFHVSSESEDWVALATLHIEKDGDEALLYPVNGFLGHLEVRENPDRRVRDHSFLFIIPQGFRHGTLNMTATVNPGNVDWTVASPLETSNANNSISTSVFFDYAPELELAVYRVAYPNENPDIGLALGTILMPGEWEQDNLIDWLEKAYPTPGVNLFASTINFPGGLVEDASALNALLANIRENNLELWYAGEDALGPYTHYHAMVSDLGRFMRGQGMSNPPVCSGPTGNPAGQNFASWDTDNSYGDWYGGHEIAHTYARGHPTPGGDPDTEDDVDVGCGHSQSDDNYPHAGASITSAANGAQAFYGFDGLAVFDENWTDFMSYCSFQWVSDYTYEGIYQRLLDELPGGPPGDGGGAGAAAAELERLGIVGLIRDGVVELQPFFCYPPNAKAPDLRIPGDWAIVLRDTANSELARYPFTPTEIDGGPSDDPSNTEPEVQMICEVVLLAEGTEIIEIEGPDGIEAIVPVSASSPSASVLSPTGGDVFEPGEQMLIHWSSEDDDGDALFANVEFSSNGGTSWHVLAASLSGNELIIPVADLSPGTQCLIRLRISDGANTTTVVSDDFFTVAAAAPILEVLQPLAPISICPLDALELQARVRVNGPQPLDSSVTWTSNIDGELGQGSDLTIHGLSTGVHQITVVATHDGLSTEVELPPVTVVGNPLLISTTPDRLRAEPSNIRWTAPAGNLQTQVQVFNENSESDVRYSLLSSPDWVAIASLDGTTSDTLTMSFTGELPAPGTYEGQVRLGSPDVADDTLINISLKVAETPIFVPEDGPEFVRGDSNGDGELDIADPIFSLGCLFSGATCPACEDAADINDSGSIDISDPVYSLVFTFLGGTAPASPWPNCGTDPSNDLLSPCLETSCP